MDRIGSHSNHHAVYLDIHIVEVKTTEHFSGFTYNTFDEFRMRIVVLSGQENGVPV